MSRTLNTAAVAGAAVVLVLALWLDTSVIANAQQQEAETFDLSGVMPLLTLGPVAVAGGCLAVAWLGYRAAPLVGLIYAVVGGFLALLPWLVLAFATQVNDTPPVLPDPIAQAMGEILYRTQGPRNAVGVVGGAMLITGLVAVIRPLRKRSLAGGTALPAPDPGRS